MDTIGIPTARRDGLRVTHDPAICIRGDTYRQAWYWAGGRCLGSIQTRTRRGRVVEIVTLPAGRGYSILGGDVRVLCAAQGLRLVDEG